MRRQSSCSAAAVLFLLLAVASAVQLSAAEGPVSTASELTASYHRKRGRHDAGYQQPAPTEYADAPGTPALSVAEMQMPGASLNKTAALKPLPHARYKHSLDAWLEDDHQQQGARRQHGTDLWVSDWMVTLMSGLAPKKIGPTRTARILFLFSSAQYDAWQYVTAGAQASDGLPPAKCQAFLDPPAAPTAAKAWLEAADRFIASTLFASQGYDPSFVAATVAKHDAEAPAELAAAIARVQGSACFADYQARTAAYFATRAQDGSADAQQDVPVGPLGPPLVNLAFNITANDDAAAELQNLNDLPDPTQWTPAVFSAANGQSTKQAYLTPAWGRVANIIPEDEAAALLRFIRDRAPSEAGRYARDIDEVLRASGRLTDTDKMTAEFWSGAPGSVFPPGLWTVISAWLAEGLRLSPEDQVLLYWQVNQAMFVSSITVWATKRRVAQLRPIQAIRQRYRSQMVADYRGPVDGAAWHPYQEAFVVTPPFPDFPSGHSTFSAAGAAVIRSLLGCDRVPPVFVTGHLLRLINPILFDTPVDKLRLGTWPFLKGSSAIQPGVAPSRSLSITWGTFSDLARAARRSRIFGGIHGEYANGPALELGSMIGELIHARSSILAGRRTITASVDTVEAPRGYKHYDL